MAGAGKTERVRYGHPIRFSGVASGGSGRTVRLEHAARGQGFRPVASTVAAADGSYRFTVRASRSGAYRALAQPAGAASASASGLRRVTVVAAIGARSARHVLGVRSLRVSGRLLPALRGRTVSVQKRTRRGWSTVARTRTGRGGTFSARYRPRRVGTYRLRVRFAGDSASAGATRVLRAVRVYRSAHASWYGPGLYGNRLGCGGTLRPGTLGVAHKTLPCGTRVTFRYRGRSVTAPVVDRGPYVGGREWDLTAALRARLHFPSTGTVWTNR